MSVRVFKPRTSVSAIVSRDTVTGEIENTTVRVVSTGGEVTISSTKGLAGRDGRTPELRAANGYIQYRTGDDWIDIVAIADISGTDGEDGVTPQLRGTASAIQYSFNGVNWTDLVALSAIKGQKGDTGEEGNTPTFRISGDYLQYSRDDGATWSNLVQLAEIQGPMGASGSDGHTPQMRIENGYLQVRYFVAGEEIEYDWVNMLALADLAGADGLDGEQGPQGLPGAGVPAGGTAGQVLAKIDSADRNTQWIAPPSGDVKLTGGNTYTTGKQTLAAGAAGYASLNIPTGSAPTSPVAGDIWFESTGTLYIRKASATRSIVTNDGATFAGRVATAASTTGGAGLNLPHGSAPTSPSNGDLWTTSTGVFARVNGVTKQIDGATNTFTSKVNFAAPTTSAASINLGVSANTPTAPINGDVWMDDFGLNYRVYDTTYQVPIEAAVPYLATTWSNANTYNGPNGRIVLAAVAGAKGRLNIGSATNPPSLPDAGDIWAQSNVLKYRKGSTTVDILTSDMADDYYVFTLYLTECPSAGTDIKIPLGYKSFIDATTATTMQVVTQNGVSSGALSFDLRTNYGATLVQNYNAPAFSSPSTTAGTSDTVDVSGWITLRVVTQNTACGPVTLTFKLKKVR
jgi:hypothetical protein